MATFDVHARIIRAACGDAQSLAALARRDNQRIVMRLAALLALDPDPPPLALGAALALLDDPPESLRARVRARAEATLQALCEPDAAPLIAALWSYETTFRRAVAALETLDQTRAAPIFAVLDMLDPLSPPTARLSAAAAPPALRAAIPMILAVATRDPWVAARAAGALWNVLDDEQRAMLARRADAADLLERIGPDGWRIAPDDARQTLLDAVAKNPKSAARGGGAVWAALDDDERVLIARSADAADLLERIGPDGWRIAPEEARRALLDAAASKPNSAAWAGVAVWTALNDEQRAMIANSAAQHAFFAADLMASIGADGWRIAPDDARQTLLDAVAKNPKSAARGGGAVWAALDDKQRAMIANSADAADLIARIGADGWRMTSDATRRALLAAAASDPQAAARAGGKVWAALDDAERALIARSAAHPPPRPSTRRGEGVGWGEAAADLMARIGPDGWMVAPEDARRALLEAVTRAPWSAAHGGGAVWTALDDDTRIMIARRAYAADLMERIGAAGWMVAPDAARQTLLEAVANDPWRASSAGAAVWTALDDEQRAMLARRAAQPPPRPSTRRGEGVGWGESAADFLASIGAAGLVLLAPDARRAALKAAFRSPKQARRVAETLWQRMDAAERAAAMRSIARNPNELDVWIEQAGAAAWGSLDPQKRAAALERMARNPQAAARLGVALWDALDNEQRSTIARSAARAPDAAAPLIAGAGERLDDDQIAALVRAAIGGANSKRATSQALADGLPWRAWMSLFTPAANDDANVWDAWRAVIHRTPTHVAARLSPQRRLSR